MLLVRIVLLTRTGHCFFIVDKFRNLAGGGSDGAVMVNNDCLARIGHIGETHPGSVWALRQCQSEAQVCVYIRGQVETDLMGMALVRLSVWVGCESCVR